MKNISNGTVETEYTSIAGIEIGRLREFKSLKISGFYPVGEPYFRYPQIRSTKRAHARSHSHVRKQADHGFASVATTSLIETLSGLGYDDPYIAAALLAGAKSLIRGMPNKAPWTALLASMSAEVASVR